MSWKTSLNQMTNQLASVGEKMVTTTKAVSHTKNVHHATRIALQMPVKELAMICGRAGMAGAVVDGAAGVFHGVMAYRRGDIQKEQIAIHAGAEAGCGFVTSSAGTAGTLAAYMITGTMGPLAIAAGMGASVGSRYIYRSIIGDTLPQRKGALNPEKKEEGGEVDEDIKA